MDFLESKGLVFSESSFGPKFHSETAARGLSELSRYYKSRLFELTSFLTTIGTFRFVSEFCGAFSPL